MSNNLKPNSSTPMKKKLTKSTHVPTACLNCKKAHLACDLSRPCKRCVSLDKSSTCIDIKHKKRGRPKLSEKRWFSSVGENNGLISTSSLSELTSAPARQQSTTTTALLNRSNSIHSCSSYSPSSPPSYAHLLPFAASLLPTSSFEITQKQEHDRKCDYYPTKMLTIFLSMDLCCARASDESVDLLGRRPDTIGHCSFYELIDSDSISTLSQIHRLLLDNCHSTIEQKHPISFSTTANSDLFQKMSPQQLFSIANGSQTFKKKLKFKKEKGEVELDCKFYLGGAFGADLSEPSTLKSVYIVCIASEIPIISSSTIQQTTIAQPSSVSSLSDFSNDKNSPILTPSSIATSSPIQTSVNIPSPDIMSFFSSSAVDSLLAHDQMVVNSYPVADSPDFLTTYNSPSTTDLQEKDAMELVNQLYCSVVTNNNDSMQIDSKAKNFGQCLYSSPMSDTYSDDSIVDNGTILNENGLIMLSKTPPRIRLNSLSDHHPLW